MNLPDGYRRHPPLGKGDFGWCSAKKPPLPKGRWQSVRTDGGILYTPSNLFWGYNNPSGASNPDLHITPVLTQTNPADIGGIFFSMKMGLLYLGSKTLEYITFLSALTPHLLKSSDMVTNS